MTPADQLLIEPIGGTAQAPDRALWRELMLLRRRMAVLFVVVALAGCASVAAGPAQTPNAPYQQGDPRDTSGMH
jgi:hypothetical protein